MGGGMVNKLRTELLALGYRRSEVDGLLREVRKRQNPDRLTPAAQKMLSITLQEMLDFSRAIKYRKKQVK